MKSLIPIAPAYARDSVTRLRRDPNFRLDSRGDDVSAPRNLERQYALVHEENVALEAAAFVLCADNVDDARDPYFAADAGHDRPDENDIVELQVLLRLDRDPPLKGRRAFGAEHHADLVALVRHVTVLDICLPERKFERPLDERPVAKAVTEDTLELADRIEILRRPRISADD